MIIFTNEDDEYPYHQVTVSQAFFSEKKILKCILGSCVSVILLSSSEGEHFSSLSHYLLDEPEKENSKPSHIDEDKYGSVIIKKQIIEMLKKVKLSNLKAMVFGGSEGSNFFKARIIADIGQRNISIAEKVLNEYNIEIIAKNTGGKTGRFVEFNPVRKSVILKLMQENETLHYSIN